MILGWELPTGPPTRTWPAGYGEGFDPRQGSKVCGALLAARLSAPSYLRSKLALEQLLIRKLPWALLKIPKRCSSGT